MDLFSKDQRVYVIDTDALITLDKYFKKGTSVFTAIWEEIEDLIRQGCSRTIDFVEQEINEYKGKEDFLKRWVKDWKKHLVATCDSASINATKPIIDEEYFTGFLNARKQAEGKEEADPFLIGYCKVHNCVLITNENKSKPNRLPAVAKKNNVECIDVLEFMEERKLIVERKK